MDSRDGEVRYLDAWGGCRSSPKRGSSRGAFSRRITALKRVVFQSATTAGCLGLPWTASLSFPWRYRRGWVGRRTEGDVKPGRWGQANQRWNWNTYVAEIPSLQGWGALCTWQWFVMITNNGWLGILRAVRRLIRLILDSIPRPSISADIHWLGSERFIYPR